jgi:hypothetical protein
MKYAIKRGDKYFTGKCGWSKDILNAWLRDEDIWNVLIKRNPDYYKDCKTVEVKETYTREEVKE